MHLVIHPKGKENPMSVNEDNRTGKLSRRKFLNAVGKGALALAAPAILGIRPARGQQARPKRFVIAEDRFGRIFPQLPPFAESSSKLEAALLEIGKSGGILDAKDALDRGPVDLIVDLTLSASNPNNGTHTAGTTFMGQFMDHDMTFDLTSRLGQATDPAASPNFRTPALDLDAVYGGGPIADRELYERVGRNEHPTKFKVEKVAPNSDFEDLPREGNGTAIIADPRNDENMMIAGLHAAFLLFHNRVVDLIGNDSVKLVSTRGRREEPDEVYRRARQLTTWHYQWMIVHEFLPLFTGQKMVDTILAQGRKFYTPEVAQIPVEFQGAAYRFGHSMVRPSYRANFTSLSGEPFFGMIFDPSQENSRDPDDLRGGSRAARRFIGWQTFFDFGDGNMRPNKQIDTKISTPLFDLPLAAIASLSPPAEPPTSLPQRNLLRQVTWQLPSGQSIAKHIKVPMLSSQDFNELKDYGQKLDESTPLWYYVLKEAEIVEKGLHLGPVGGRIVGEVIIGLLQLDRDSYLADNPHWRPSLPQRSGQVTGDFRMVDFLTFAGVAQLR
jgi:Animal haem peroxidase